MSGISEHLPEQAAGHRWLALRGAYILALEDNYQRLQERMFRMFGVNDTCNLHFATVAKQVGKGLDEQLENFVREHPETKLIIVDTLQKFVKRQETGMLMPDWKERKQSLDQCANYYLR